MDVFESSEKNRGRLENRYVALYRKPLWVPPQWKGIQRVVHVRRCGNRPKTGAFGQGHYFITSLDTNDAAMIAQGIRGHWQIENGLHYVKDVNFGEDRCRINVGQAVEVQSMLINIAINIYRGLGFRSIKKGTIYYANKVKELSELLHADRITNFKN